MTVRRGRRKKKSWEWSGFHSVALERVPLSVAGKVLGRTFLMLIHGLIRRRNIHSNTGRGGAFTESPVWRICASSIKKQHTPTAAREPH